MREAEDRAGNILQDRREQREQAQQDAAQGAPAPPAPDASAAPPEAGGSQAPPSNAGDESPDRNFPVPPVPPPPSPGPIFGLAGSGQGGPTSFARPGTAAAKPFRSPIFTANRSTAAPGVGQRFGAGAALTAGGGSTPAFLPAGLSADSPTPGAGADEELRRIMAALRGGGGARF